MRLKAITTALLLSGMTMPGQALAQAPNPYNADWLVYSVNQVCQVWWNGVTQCIPVALMGPAPTRGAYPLDNLAGRAAPRPMSASPAPGRTAYPATASLPAPNPYPKPHANPYLAYVTPPVKPAPLPVPVMAPTAMAAPQPVRVPALPVVPAWPTVPSLPALAWPTLPTPQPAWPWPFGAMPGPAATPAVPANAQATAEAAPAVPAAMPDPVSQPVMAERPDVRTTQAAPAPALVHFDFDSDRLTPSGQQVLDQWLDRHPGDGPLRLTGHADRLGPLRYNAILSRRRADAVRHYLTSKGMRPNDIHILAKGETDPVIHCPGGASETTKDCLAPNRRVEIQPL